MCFYGIAYRKVPCNCFLGRTGWSSVRESTSHGNGWYNSEAEDDDQDQYQDQDQDQDQEQDQDQDQEIGQNQESRVGEGLSRTSSTRSVNKISGGDCASTAGSSSTLVSVRKPSGPAPTISQESVEGLPPLPMLPNPFEPEPTWQSLSEHTAATIDNLLASAEKGYKPYYLIQSSIVVEAIRVMLYASGTVDKDAAVMRQHRALKSHHRQIMATLSKLVLSAKMASSVWPAPDSVAKLQADAQEVKAAAETYISTAIAAGITVHQVDARLVTDVKSPLRAKAAARALDKALSNASSLRDNGPTSDRKVFSSQMSSQNILGQLDYYSKSAAKTLNIMAKQIENVIDNPPPNPRNSGYNGLSATAAIMTSSQSAQLTLELALNTTLATVSAAQSLDQAARTLIQEKEASDTAATSMGRSPYDPFGISRKASVLLGIDRTEDIMFNHDNDSDIEPDLAPRSLTHAPPHHRNRSDSQPSLFSANSNSSTYTPGTDYSGRCMPVGYPFPTSPSESTFSSGNNGRHNLHSDKLKKLLGDEAPGRPSASTQLWFLCYDYQPGDIILNAEGQVKGGTLPALIERLTLHDGLDHNFIATFLLTYRSFTTTNELFKHLFHRFTVQAPMGMESDEMDMWTEKKLTPIRLRVFNIIKSWLETYYLEDEVDDKEALAMIKEFSGSTAMRDTMSFAAVQLIKLVEKREQSESAFRKMVLNFSTQAPPPIVPRNLKKIKFLELDPLEFARQLTIMEASVYNKIRPVECLAKAWTSEDPDIAAKAVNIKKMIETSNLYANWINELVLSEKEIKKRVLVIRHLVLIAEKLRVLNNFSMLSATMAALSQSPIHRLKRTWEQVPARTMTSFMDLQALMGVARNWAEYREELHNVNPPCVPFVGMYLTDLVMIQDGNGDFLKKTNHLINFYKRVKTAEVIREIQQYQSVPYCLTGVPEIQAFIRRGLDGTKSVGDLYDMSLALEPRERGDDKIARLLTESGMM
ncbi:hypothetical protein BGZ65_000936 [Modicella reniformis]|uniref:Ras guanine nucleotide exchange factor domain-containing protein n=1 Tax=Modicella reniformis TaxID=1440133 RepID=A0A9P6IRP2_9FUNG|nr:hypothetical protein BGZ65_000936 [Modicella reniformis]